jgi:hypothetical protein
VPRGEPGVVSRLERIDVIERSRADHGSRGAADDGCKPVLGLPVVSAPMRRRFIQVFLVAAPAIGRRSVQFFSIVFSPTAGDGRVACLIR